MSTRKNNKNKTPKSTDNGGRIKGLLELIALVSMSYLVYMVMLGTEGIEPKIMALPTAAFVVWRLTVRFTK